MIKGELVLIPFPFTDLTGLKNRPALVLISSKDDVTVAFISSQLRSENDSDIQIHPSDLNGLKKPSIVRISKIATIEKSLILGKLGNLSLQEMKMVDQKLILAFQLTERR
jgi:mRNA interferase MazF